MTGAGPMHELSSVGSRTTINATNTMK